MNLGILALTLPLMGVEPVPPPIPAPFTFVRVDAPKNSKATWIPGTSQAVPVKNGAVVALRPGYMHRFELADVGETKTSIIWPSIEVRGALVPKPTLNVADHPIPIVFTDEDIESILQGRFLTRIYYLEDPNKAINGPQPLGIPQEFSIPDEMEGYKEARARGRLMIIVRAGERLWTPDELARENVPGTVFVPDVMKTPSWPAAPPTLEHWGVLPFDPILGPRMLEGECLHDGGDRHHNLGVGRDEKLFGLDPSDTSLEYNTPNGKKVATSNRVCICIPRYAAMRIERGVISQHAYRGPEIRYRTDLQQAVIHKTPPVAVNTFEQPINQNHTARPSGLINEIPALTKHGLVSAPVAFANLKGVSVAARLLEPNDLTVYPDCQLVLEKRMDPPNPKKIGEIVTFYLRYRNATLEPISDVVVSDSLTGRLEYIEASAKSDRGATFTATPNEAGSVVLRWAIDGKLLPGHHGIVSFQARIR